MPPTTGGPSSLGTNEQNPNRCSLAMPLVANQPPDPSDPRYQQLERVINLAVHGALFAFVNSGLWLLRGLRSGFAPWLPWLTAIWAMVWLVQLIVVLRQRPAAASAS